MQLDASPASHATPAPLLGAPLVPASVSQPWWQATCYILAPLQAIAAQCPQRLTAMVAPTAGGISVRCFVVAPAARPEGAQGPRFLPAPVAAGQVHVAWRDSRSMPWPKVLLRACQASVGSVGFPDAVLQWALGCRVHTARLPRAPDARQAALAALAGLFVGAECIVLYTPDHCMALVGATVGGAEDPLGWSMTIADPRRRKVRRATPSDLRALRYVHAYSVTLGLGTDAQPRGVPAVSRQRGIERRCSFL